MQQLYGNQALPSNAVDIANPWDYWNQVENQSIPVKQEKVTAVTNDAFIDQ